MGLPHSLHRISAIRNKAGGICGLTYRIGRHIPGVGRLILDVLAYMKRSLSHGRPQSLLLLGRPGVGKTTLLRDVARLLSDPREKGGLGLKVVVVDTSNETGGDADQVSSDQTF
jgi:stage III sporulation protein SpoIIIAA